MKLYSTEEERQELNCLYQKAAAELYDKQQKEAFIAFIERFSDIYLNTCVLHKTENMLEHLSILLLTIIVMLFHYSNLLNY